MAMRCGYPSLIEVQPKRRGALPLKFLKRLVAKQEPPSILTDRLWGQEVFGVNVTALSTKSLDVYWKATSNEWRRKEGERHLYEYRTDVTLVSDTENRAPHAMRVEIAGKVIGHLGHSDALQIYRRLNDLGYSQIHSICQAKLVGRTGHWDVKLDLDLQLSDTRSARP